MKKQPKKARPKGARRVPDATLIYYDDGGFNLVWGAVVPFSRNKQCAIPYTLIPLYAADQKREAELARLKRIERAAKKVVRLCPGTELLDGLSRSLANSHELNLHREVSRSLRTKRTKP